MYSMQICQYLLTFLLFLAEALLPLVSTRKRKYSTSPNFFPSLQKHGFESVDTKIKHDVPRRRRTTQQ